MLAWKVRNLLWRWGTRWLLKPAEYTSLNRAAVFLPDNLWCRPGLPKGLWIRDRRRCVGENDWCNPEFPDKEIAFNWINARGPAKYPRRGTAGSGQGA